VLRERNTTHGRAGTPTYFTWIAMRDRVDNPKHISYKYYGGRGIRVCRRWSSFANFFADMGPRPPGLTIERVNNDGHYCPSNCIWADAFTQAQNKRPRKDRIHMTTNDKVSRA
jgi:hypothetical protein